MPSFDWGGASGVTTGATAVDVVPSPAAGTKRRVKNVIVTNVDTASAVVTFYFDDNGTTRQVGPAVTLAVNEAAGLGEGDVLDSTQKIQVALDNAASTTELDYVASWADYVA